MEKLELDLTVIYDSKKAVAEEYNLSEMPSAIVVDHVLGFAQLMS